MADVPFKLLGPDDACASPMRLWSAGVLERILRIDRLNCIYQRVIAADQSIPFLRRVLDDLQVSWDLFPQDLARIPRQGPLIVVANHPFGAIEGMVLAAVLTSVRNDVRLMANHILGRITELRDLFILVDPFGRASSIRDNMQPLRECLRLLKSGGALGVFPAGEVAHLDLRSRRVVDPPWSPTIARMVRKSGAAVLPVFFHGRNSTMFQLLGLVHPRLRTALLPREFCKKQGTRLDMQIGSPIAASRLEAFETDEDLMTYLRERTHVLALRSAAASITPAPALAVPVVPAAASEDLAAEVESLNPRALLLEAGDFQTWIGRARQIPCILREIGRLREITFRAAGEGTGRQIDLDRFDRTYLHLFVWDRSNRQIAGAYRLGPADRIVPRQGVRGLYSSTLFHYGPELMTHCGATLELGRSFVRPEYQRTYAPLLLLWRGIGQYLLRNPRYRVLFGPVSISNSYQSASQQLMVRFLQTCHGASNIRQMVRARRPFRVAGAGPNIPPMWLRDNDDVSRIVGDIEPDLKGIPVLLRQYLKLGAKFLAFSVDPDFNNTVDGLILIDLLRADPRVLDRYMGGCGRKQYLAYHHQHADRYLGCGVKDARVTTERISSDSSSAGD